MNTSPEQVNLNNTLENREQLTFNGTCITISGRSGTGKTVTASIIGRMLGIPPENIHKAGKKFRQKHREDTGTPLLGYRDRPDQEDIDLDQDQIRLLENATSENPEILEGRLAGIMATKVLQSDPERSIVRLLFTCEEKERQRRIVEREHHVHPEKNPEIIIADSLSRDKQDEEKWERMYETLLQGKGVYDRTFYDFAIDTSNRNVEEVANYVVEQLKSNSYVTPL